jgi:hypothetical protein
MTAKNYSATGIFDGYGKFLRRIKGQEKWPETDQLSVVVSWTGL